MPRGVRKKTSASEGVASAAPNPVEAAEQPKQEAPRKKMANSAMVKMGWAENKGKTKSDGARTEAPKQTAFKAHMFDDESFDGENLQGVDFSGSEFTGCSFVGADLRWTNWNGCTIEGCDFDGANLLEARDVRGHIIDINGTSPE